MFNIPLYNELQIIEQKENIECFLINMDDETQRFAFLLPPNSITISGGADYTTTNAMFGSKPVVKYRGSTPTRLTIDNLRLLTPNATRNLSIIEARIDSLRYSSGLKAPQEIENIDETPFFEDNPELQLGYRYNVGGQRPPQQGQSPQQGNRPPQQGQNPQQGGRPPQQGQNPQQGQFPGSGSQIPQMPNEPPRTPQDPNRPPSEPTNPPENPDEEPIDPTDPGEEVPETPEEPITPIPVIQAVASEPPKLSLVFGERVIQPLRLESYTITELEQANGLPTDIIVSMTFIGVDNPII